MADAGSRSLVIQLDLSAAFDTVDITTLVRRLECTFGIQGTALHWLQSYVSGRSQFVRIGGQQSTPIMCEAGVPHGSVLGPLLFSLYVAPIADVIARCGVDHAQYADDTQLYIALKSSDALDHIAVCFSRLSLWFAINGLSLNPDKSEAIVIGTSKRLHSEPSVDTIVLDDIRLSLQPCVKSLGVMIDNKLSFEPYVNYICKTANYHIRALRHIRKCISADTAKIVASALVGSRLDYCNALLYGTTMMNIRKLQRVQNLLARTVMQANRRTDIEGLLSELHWLPVAARIDYKVALLTYKTLTTNRPNYLADLLSMHVPVRQLRSSSRNRLSVPPVNTVFASRAFVHAAPAVWNSLPIELTDSFRTLTASSFKRRLKSYYFSQSYRRR
jgi:hypothetical protein